MRSRASNAADNDAADREETDVLQITPEECATLQLLADGKRTSEIADRLRVPEHRIDEQLTTLFARLGATNRTEAVAAAFKRGLVVEGQIRGSHNWKSGIPNTASAAS
jgi:DNA-binding NarL/FixJ family response regulator